MSEDLPTVDPAHTALLVMDYQPGIISRLDDPETLIAKAQQAISLARERGAHVGYVRVAFADSDLEDMPETSRMGALAKATGDALHADSPATQIHPDVAPEEGDIVVRKVRVGAFSTTDLADQLADRGVRNLILAGVSTSGVVLSTVRDAHDRDYRVFVLADATADTQPGLHEFLTERIFPRQAHVITTAEMAQVLAR